MDERATLSTLKDRVTKFCEERDWDQFHGPKDLAIGLITEAAELLERFRFRSDVEASALLDDPAQRQRVEDELADILFFLLRFAQRTGIDMDDALAAKIEKNAKHYPVSKSRGKNLKYTEI
jgi:NTP pyrophosphatase (non-canonical NTP hydrolase)